MVVGGFQQANNDQVFDGDIVIRHLPTIPSPGTRARFDRDTGSAFIFNNQGDRVFQLRMPEANLSYGGRGFDADLYLYNRHSTDLENTNEAVFQVDTDRGVVVLGGGPSNGRVGGRLVCLDALSQQTIFLDGTEAGIFAGANGKDGKVTIQNANNQALIRLDSADVIEGSQETAATIKAGGRGRSSLIQLFPTSANNFNDFEQASITLLASSGTLALGSPSLGIQGRIVAFDINNHTTLDFSATTAELLVGGGLGGGSIELRARRELANVPGGQTDTIRLSSDTAKIFAGGSSSIPIDGSLVLNDRFGINTISLETGGASSTIRIGGSGGNEGNAPLNTRSGNLIVRNGDNQTTIELRGEDGDVILQNADCAEDFEIALGVEAAPGTVMVLDVSGKLRASAKPYDKQVAGIVAGGGDLRPGIILGRRSDAINRVPIALFGRTYCKVDATNAPISAGDLLTTSSTPGAAMRATDLNSSFGAIVGKAIQPLSDGIELIQILVALQ